MNGMNRDSGATLDDIGHLRQSIADILTTPIGSRVMRREYGSQVPDLIDQPDNGAIRVRLYAACATALLRWEPRLRLNTLRLVAGNRPGQRVLDVEGTIIVANKQRTTSLQILLTGAST